MTAVEMIMLMQNTEGVMQLAQNKRLIAGGGEWDQIRTEGKALMTKMDKILPFLILKELKEKQEEISYLELSLPSEEKPVN